MSAGELEPTPRESLTAARLRRALRDIAEESPVRLDARGWVATARSRRRFGSFLPVGLAAALIVAVAGVSAFAVWTGNQPSSSSSPQSRPGHFDNGTFSFDYPTSWRTIAGDSEVLPPIHTFAVLGTGGWHANCYFGSNDAGCNGDTVDVSGGRVVVKVYERNDGPGDLCGPRAAPDATFGPNAVSEQRGGAVTWEIRRPGAEFGWLDNVFVEVTTDNPSELSNAESLVASFRWAPGVRSDGYCYQLDTPTPTPIASPPTKLSIYNGTTIVVTLVVNGTVIEIVPPRSREDPITGALPALPWNVETRSPSGRVLSTLVIRQGDYFQTTLPNGDTSTSGDFSRVDLSCGRLDVWQGIEPLGPVFSPGPSGDCV
jgi:hypothetical protein